jgi:hypothetical protein
MTQDAQGSLIFAKASCQSLKQIAMTDRHPFADTAQNILPADFAIASQEHDPTHGGRYA